MGSANGGKLRRISLDDFVRECACYISPRAFTETCKDNAFGLPNYFLVSHGSLDEVVLSKPERQQDNTGYAFKSLHHEDLDAAEMARFRFIFSKGGVVFVFYWANCWHPEVGMSEKITVGRSGSSDIVLKDPRVSTAHGCFFLNRDRVCFIDISSYGTKINGMGMRKETAVAVPSKSEMVIGPYTFSLFNPEDMHRIVDMLR